MLIKALENKFYGGVDETQTHDILAANQMLYQLSYYPTKMVGSEVVETSLLVCNTRVLPLN